MTSTTAERFDPEDNPAARVGKCRLTRGGARGGETYFPPIGGAGCYHLDVQPQGG